MGFTSRSARGPQLSRRQMLTALGVAGAAAASAPVLSSCGVGGRASQPNGAGAVTGGFDWRKAAGSTISILQTPHPYQLSYQPLLQEFTELTGINVNVDLVPEADYFTKLNTELAGGSGKHDAFMLGAYFIWQYGPPGWVEDLDPWLRNSSATNAEYDFEDIFEGLRTSTRWDFTLGNPLGTGGQWAIPWGFENNVVAYNKRVFDEKGITKLPDNLDDFIQLAVDLTDRSANQYGISTRGSKSWATIHPGFMTQYTRQGAVDYTWNGSELVAEMDSDAAIDFTQKWITMQHEAGPTSWTTYDYPNATGDLGDGKAMMVFDADSATYPKNKPGASREAGNIAWYAGPAGPDGNYKTNLWTWSWAMSANSRNKLPAWLFIQWATGKESMNKAVEGGQYADPVRQSVFDTTFKRVAADQYGYLEAFETVIGESKIQFTPQKKFFDTTQNWAVALQDIYGGDDATTRLRSLAKTNTSKVNL
ncbi:carbohydrate ABC transporter substrate-binding protein, CUT1 family [Mycolicibacterium aurum]|uniref:Carbohydrate ABC transporter substrate-binding protein, CUT1 family n=1 Tax=Mycolicibacterium aurum TaxID=1791 RepID=A0A3S4VXH4_MYCAU|nr:extracellular solute-binding protein [Mycolicibacterium aurum]VEG57717.1 carbohydrate ABC transporter substrate-binding protein, CUT1 family [Mycolicibacterium aurum]